MPCASATFTVWSSAWLAGAAAPDDVLDALGPWGQLHDVVTTDADTARTYSLSAPGAPPGSVTFLLAALRRAAPANQAEDHTVNVAEAQGTGVRLTIGPPGGTPTVRVSATSDYPPWSHSPAP